MSNLISAGGHFELHPGMGGLQLYSGLMAPQHGPIPIAGLIRGLDNGLKIALRLIIDGNNYLSPFHHRIYTVQELADLWERVHHGYDPRGLDPRVEPTRLTVNRR